MAGATGSSLLAHEASIATDGNATHGFFHSSCNGPEQWFALKWKGPMVLHQIVLHNRQQFRHRLVGSTVRLLGAGGEVLWSQRVAVSRYLYAWSLQPHVGSVTALEVRLSREACLHFNELEAFGASEADVADGAIDFRRKVEIERHITVAPTRPAAASFSSKRCCPTRNILFWWN